MKPSNLLPDKWSLLPSNDLLYITESSIKDCFAKPRCIHSGRIEEIVVGEIALGEIALGETALGGIALGEIALDLQVSKVSGQLNRLELRQRKEISPCKCFIF
jgi:hypothetical protein